MILGACIIAPAAGGLAGATINTTPLEAAGDPLATIPRHALDGGAMAYPGLDTPDHYPLVTSHGTIPVEELLFHGPLGRRYDPSYAPGYAPPAVATDRPAPGEDGASADDSESQRAADIAQLVPVGAPQHSPQLVPIEPGAALTAVHAGSAGDGGAAILDRSTT